MLVTNCCFSNYREQISLQICTHVTGKVCAKKSGKAERKKQDHRAMQVLTAKGQR